MAAAQAHIGGITAHHDLFALADNMSVLHARIERRLAPAPANRLDFFNRVRPTQQFAAALEQLAAEICTQAIADDRNILLIDDILTTGATLREAARVLREAGAEKVICATLAAADED